MPSSLNRQYVTLMNGFIKFYQIFKATQPETSRNIML